VPFEIKEVYEIKDFTAYNDEEFVKNGFIGVLNRHPDSVGMTDFLEKLRSGKRSKIENLAALRFSKEGKSKKVIIRGIRKYYLQSIIYKTPIIGYLAKTLYTLITLPNLLKRLNQLENHFSALHTMNEQNEFKLQNAINQKLSNKAEREELTQTKEELTSDLSSKVEHKDLELYLQTVTHAHESMKISQKNIQTLVDAAKKRLPKEMLNQKELLAIIEEEKHKLDTFYVNFEDKFRGSRAEITKRLEAYLPYIKDLPFKQKKIKALDVGCGRGEWIELLGNNGYNAKGIDLNRIMIKKSQKLGLEVKEADVIDHLESLENESLHIITGFHIIEHLDFEVLIQMFDESLRVLKPGGLIIFETPNPKNLTVGACNFYTDPTHINPIPPHTLEFMLQERGFINIEKKDLQVYETIGTGNDYLNEFINEWVNTSSDYAAIGYKA